MRLALISDIHGNLTALQTVLEDIRRERIDSIICLGDVATNGPHPKQVIAELQRLGCPCILGNHESAVLDPDAALRYQIAPTLIESLHWTRDQLAQSELDYLRAFKPTISVALGDSTQLLCFHASPLSNTDLLLAMTPVEDLAEMLAGCDAKFFAGGHTHIQMLRQYDGLLIINPGSVGQPFRAFLIPGSPPALLPWAEYAILEWANRALSVGLRRLPFDVIEYCRAVSASGIPIKDWLLNEYSGAK